MARKMTRRFNGQRTEKRKGAFLAIPPSLPFSTEGAWQGVNSERSLARSVSARNGAGTVRVSLE